MVRQAWQMEEVSDPIEEGDLHSVGSQKVSLLMIPNVQSPTPELHQTTVHEKTIQCKHQAGILSAL